MIFNTRSDVRKTVYVSYIEALMHILVRSASHIQQFNLSMLFREVYKIIVRPFETQTNMNKHD